jgi:tRNA G18 (ribose-2'-O)-methylase SpoU
MSQMGRRVGQLAGIDLVAGALREREDVRLLLVDEGCTEPALRALIELAQQRGIRVRGATRRVLTRLSAVDPAPPVLALVGRDPAADLEATLGRGGAVWLMTGVAYPGNVGMVIRTAEVSGADAILVDADFDHVAKRAALRASMRADRFMPVIWSSPGGLLDAATRSGHRVFALDEAGESAPWEVDLTGPRVFVVGGENGGIGPEVLARCDARIRVPMAGFIPCYNLQAAVSAVACERLRQLELAASSPPATR